MKIFLKKIINKLSAKKRKSKNIQFLKKSYSQCGEDLIIKYIFDTLKIQNPSYIDIGAHHPYYISNTALFYSNGSRGINIEPDPWLFKNFLAARKEDINLNVGIGNKNEILDFYIISSPSLNTFSKIEAENYKLEGNYSITNIEKVGVRTLNDILMEHYGGNFPNFLSIDAEGIDEIIIKSIDFDENYPIVICIETISFSESGNGVKNKNLIKFIEEKGYLYYADTNINSIFVKESHWKK